MRDYRLLWILPLWLLASASAHATITLFSAAVTPTTVTLTRATPVRVQWTITGTPATCVVGSSYTVSSSEAKYFANADDVLLGTRLATVSGSTRITSCVGVAPPPQTVRITEYVPVPASVVRRALSVGASKFTYYRSFTDGSGSSSWEVTLYISAAQGGGALTITRIALHFDDGATTRVIERGAKIGAVAQINFSGSGTLRAVWEIARPPSTQGEAAYVPLRVVTRFMGGSGQAFLPAPPLPADMTGRYVLRLRLLAPDEGLGNPILRYVVIEQAPPAPPPPAVLDLNEPQENARLAKDTWFSWQAVPNARAYQLEIYAAAGTGKKQERAPVSGILVGHIQTRVQLSQLAREHLAQGRHYRWRVIAIGATGQVLAESAPRMIIVP